MPDQKLLITLFAVIGLGACSSAPRQPDWIDRADDSYPADTYLTATASAADRDTAADRARANLAKVFEVAVQESTLDFSSAAVTVAGTGQASVAATANEQRVARTVNTEARQVLEGTEMPEYWDAGDGRV